MRTVKRGLSGSPRGRREPAAKEPRWPSGELARAAIAKASYCPHTKASSGRASRGGSAGRRAAGVPPPATGPRSAPRWTPGRCPGTRGAPSSVKGGPSAAWSGWPGDRLSGRRQRRARGRAAPAPRTAATRPAAAGTSSPGPVAPAARAAPGAGGAGARGGPEIRSRRAGSGGGGRTERRPALGSGRPGQARCAAELGAAARGAVRGAERPARPRARRGSAPRLNGGARARGAGHGGLFAVTVSFLPSSWSGGRGLRAPRLRTGWALVMVAPPLERPG